MDHVLLLKALLLGIVEGITEFLPISSTGHLIIAGQLLGFSDEKSQVFYIVIQSGAMLAVLWEYRARFMHVLAGLTREPAAQRFALNLIVALLPAIVLGLLFGKFIKAVLFKPVPVALALIAGGLFMLWIERRRVRPPRIDDVDAVRPLDAFKIGCAQTAALIPGISRSGATIIGGMLFGLSRRAATEFSFFLAVPTLTAAGVYDLFKHRALLSAADLPLFAVGTAAAFLSALLGIRWLLRYVTAHDFTVFAWYRIAFGLLVLATAWTGLVNWNGA